MQNNTSFQYRRLQEIKSQEYEKFFRENDSSFHPYLNHLGEIAWMSEEEASKQHEFFDYYENLFFRLKKKIFYKDYPSWRNMPVSEREIRLQFRSYLEKSYIGRLRAETANAIPKIWENELGEEEIENIPITLEIFQSGEWRKSLLSGGIAAMLAIFALSYFLFFYQPAQYGSIIVESNVRGASIYLDEDKKGYADYSHRLEKVPFGPHRVSLQKPGYAAAPNYRDIEITSEKPVKIRIDMQEVAPEGQGHLQIIAEHQDSKIFINNEFMGNLEENPFFGLAKGEYEILVERNGFETRPKMQTVTVIPGDTLIMTFDQSPIYMRHAARASRTETATLEITTNVSGARILLNDEDTGKEADYVFTDIRPGNYTVKVVKKGYRSVPVERRLTLSTSDSNSEITFELIKEFEQVSVHTDPPNGSIFIDGELRGKGFLKESLPIGEYEISFGDLPGYNPPAKRKIKVAANTPVDIKAEYFPEMRLIAEISEDGNIIIENCDVITGYTFDNRGFSSSSEAGPEIVYHDDLKNYYWKFGFAFPFRNPKGNDALKLSFRLPHDLNYNQKFTLKLLAAMSKERYPLAISRKIEIKLKFNGNILSYYYEPKSVEDVSGMEEILFDISKFVKPGINAFEITTTGKNNTYYLLKQISISN